MAPPFTADALFVHHDSHPLALVRVLVEKLAPDWVFWEPETLRNEIRDELGRSEISTLNWQKIQAIRTCLVIDSPWENFSVFGTVLQPINNNLMDFQSMQRPTLAQCAFAVETLGASRERRFSDEVEQFIAAAALSDEVSYLPPPLEFAQEWLSQPRYRCQSCGWVGDGTITEVCWNCGSEKLDRFLVRDPEPIQKRYEEVVSSGRRDFDLEDEADVQVTRLLVVRGYLQYRANLLEEQLNALQKAGILSSTP